MYAEIFLYIMHGGSENFLELLSLIFEAVAVVWLNTEIKSKENSFFSFFPFFFLLSFFPFIGMQNMYRHWDNYWNRLEQETVIYWREEQEPVCAGFVWKRCGNWVKKLMINLLCYMNGMLKDTVMVQRNWIWM